jgi:hypothetical protein
VCGGDRGRPNKGDDPVTKLRVVETEPTRLHDIYPGYIHYTGMGSAQIVSPFLPFNFCSLPVCVCVCV